MRVLNFKFWSARQGWVETSRALAKKGPQWGSILLFQTVLAVSPIRKAVVGRRFGEK